MERAPYVSTIWNAVVGHCGKPQPHVIAYRLALPLYRVLQARWSRGGHGIHMNSKFISTLHVFTCLVEQQAPYDAVQEDIYGFE